MKFFNEKPKKNSGRLNPDLKKYKTGSYYSNWDDKEVRFDKRTAFEKEADDILNIKGKGKAVDISGKYKEKISKAEDPMVVGTNGYGNFTQNKDMVPLDVLEDQNYGQENDPENHFLPIEEVPDPDAGNFDEQIEFNDNFEDSNDGVTFEQKPLVPQKDPREVLINGMPLGDIMDGKVTENNLPHGVIQKEKESLGELFIRVQKTSVNRDNPTKGVSWGDLDNSGKYKKTKITRWTENMKAGNAKRKNLKTKPFKPWQKLQKLLEKNDNE